MYGDLAAVTTAFHSILTPDAFAIILMGLIAGITMGVLPGFGAAQALALFFPFTFFMSTEHGILFFLAIYSAAEYGGSIPAILIRTPGTPSSVVTCFDGNAMARKGLATRALRISLISGVFGGIFSTVIFGASVPALAWIGLQFGPAEMFALGVFGITIISSFFGESVVWALIAALFGLLLSTVGTSEFSGMRFTFDYSFLQDGIPVIVMVIGFLAMPEIFKLTVNAFGTKQAEVKPVAMQNNAANRVSWKDLWRLRNAMLRGGLFGTFVGALPGAGAAVVSLIVYSEERRWSKTPEAFGTGMEEGVAAPEAANNAVVSGALVPALALGIPGTASSAILLGMLISKNVVPGPTLLTEHPDFIYVIFIGQITLHLMLLILGYYGTSLFSFVTRVPEKILGPFVLFLLVIGAYSYEARVSDIGLALVLGVAGYVLRRVNIPTVPIVLAYVMGPIIENNFSRALALSHGQLTTFVTSPISAVILVLAVLSAAVGSIRNRKSMPTSA
jgi:putative tricarboxylic transport membrane protein